ncbi:MAG: glucose 1-dehydrogenase [Actinobacteria bacterium]|nr:glucose 1-dehydrogenase [Actinomycetota bacterium]
MRLKGKRTIVTGGSRGIGRGIAIAMAREGAHVAINFTANEDAAREVVERIRADDGEAVAVQADVTDKVQVDAMVAAIERVLGGIDVLVNNAGVCHFLDFFETTEAEWNFHQNVNCKGIFLCSQAAARAMKARGGGRIINVTSISGEKATSPRQVAYCASKGGANMLTQVMAVALAPYNITVNAVLPGTIETDINRDILAQPGATEEIVGATPLRTLGLPQHIAEAVIYFASDESGWTTGALLPVDGGFVL